MVVPVDPRVELFGIGDSLREARLQRGIDLASVEAATRIRAVNLDLIEQERWDALPGDVYTAGFIRTYADHLGLDAERYVEAFRAARDLEPEPIVHEAVRSVEPRPRRLVVAVALLACAAAAVVFLVLRDRGRPAAAPTTTVAAVAPKKAPKPVLASPLVIRAVRGTSWVVVRFGDSKGRLVWQGMLRRRRQLRLGLDRPLFIGLGKPEALSVRAGAKQVRLAPGHSLFVFSQAGVRAARA